MIINKAGGNSVYKNAALYGLSTDEKPLDKIPNGSSFYEMDTQRVFLFDEENKRWLQQ